MTVCDLKWYTNDNLMIHLFSAELKPSVVTTQSVPRMHSVVTTQSVPSQIVPSQSVPTQSVTTPSVPNAQSSPWAQSVLGYVFPVTVQRQQQPLTHSVQPVVLPQQQPPAQPTHLQHPQRPRILLSSNASSKSNSGQYPDVPRIADNIPNATDSEQPSAFTTYAPPQPRAPTTTYASRLGSEYRPPHLRNEWMPPPYRLHVRKMTSFDYSGFPVTMPMAWIQGGFQMNSRRMPHDYGAAVWLKYQREAGGHSYALTKELQRYNSWNRVVNWETPLPCYHTEKMNFHKNNRMSTWSVSVLVHAVDADEETKQAMKHTADCVWQKPNGRGDMWIDWVKEMGGEVVGYPMWEEYNGGRKLLLINWRSRSKSITLKCRCQLRRH